MPKFLSEITSKIDERFKCQNLIAIGGSLRAISTAIMSKNSYPLSSLHGFSYRLGDEEAYIESIANVSVLELNKFPIKKDRYDTIREGAHIFLALARALNAKKRHNKRRWRKRGRLFKRLFAPKHKISTKFQPKHKKPARPLHSLVQQSGNKVCKGYFYGT